MTSLIPSPDGLPIPAPRWLFDALLHLTFLVHLLFMNSLIGGTVIALMTRVFPGARPELDKALVGRVSKLLPVVVAGTVTFGVAPLLFMQVLFGNFFYTSSILMGWPWFMVFVILILGYYGFYLNSFKGKALGAARTPLLVFCLLVLLYTALSLVTNNVLMLRPDVWSRFYFQKPNGMHMYFGDPTLLSRYLHMITGAIAVGGLLLSLLARRESDAPTRRFIAGRGLAFFLFGTVVNLLIGLWFVFALPGPITKLMMGGSLYLTVLFGLGLALALLMIVMAWRARRDPAGAALSLLWPTLLEMIVMILQRHQIRLAYLGEAYRPQDFAVGTQALNLAIFALLLVGGGLATAWMLRMFFGARSG